MKTYEFAYGHGHVSVPLNEADILAELHGSETPPIADIRSALISSLEAPIDSKPIKNLALPGLKVALVVSDMTRFWMRQDLVVPHLVDYLLEVCGVKPSDLTIVIANGTHIGGNEQELRTLVTDGVYDRIRVENHELRGRRILYTLGQRPTKRRCGSTAPWRRQTLWFALAAATHHVMAGYGGGRKSILPGVSGLETIRHNHAYSLDSTKLCTNPAIGNGVLSGNPLHADMCEAAGMVKNLFMVNLVMNAQMKLAKIFSGHYLTAWEQACQAADDIYRVGIPCQADAIVTSCGGFPKDISLYQGTKTIDNVESALKPGGTLVLFIEAPEGGGPAEYFDWSKNLQDGTLEQRLREAFTVAGYIFFLNCEQAQRYRIFLYSSIDPKDVAPMGTTPIPIWTSC